MATKNTKSGSTKSSAINQEVNLAVKTRVAQEIKEKARRRSNISFGHIEKPV